MADSSAGRLSWQTFRPIFWILTAIYLGHRGIVWLQIPRPLVVQHFLDDLLCLPLVLTVTLFVMRFFYGTQVRFSVYQVAFVVVYVSVLFEVVLPQYMERYTGDVVDVVLYAVGGWIYYRFLNK
ncbi:hypothetical protein [Rufibacter roseus]|uniref:Magnesium citrate secondary transporter n=1 Tax=Rufibacter roseus TaxID=1567108 RepID=A0ABW2DI96_9BACT|nr:hypothetical protein [Rufibacter roseus]